MEVRCANGHDQTISDPTDDGWEYTYRDRFEPTTVTLPNGETTQIQHRVATAVGRRLVWKCAAPTEPDNPQSPLCGLVAVIEQEVADPYTNEQPVETPEGGNG